VLPSLSLFLYYTKTFHWSRDCES